LQNTAQVLLMYQLTHSVFAVGVIICAQFAGALVLGPWAAVVADRLGGKRMLIAIQILSTFVAGVITLLQMKGMLGEHYLLIAALVLGLAFTFALPVQTAIIARLVPRADTEAAMAMNSVSYNAGRALAPALCIAVVTFIGFAWAFALNAISFAIFALILGWIRPGHDDSRAGPARARDGIAIALQQPRILLLLLMVAAVTVADDPVLVLGPALAHHVLGASKDWAAYFLSALGLGTVLGSLRPQKRSGSLGTAESNAPETSRRAAKYLLMLAVSIILFASGISVWISAAAAFSAGVAALLTGAIIQTWLVQANSGNTASVMALWAIAWAGTKPIASLADGWLANSINVRAAGVILAMPALILALFEISLPDARKQKIKAVGKKYTTMIWEAALPQDAGFASPDN
jgi:predicted MFS family arabinose efflux permease